MSAAQPYNSPMRHRDPFILLSTHDLGVTGGKMETRVTLRPGDKGTKKLVQEFGQKLLCVRYRYDPVRRMRHKTVELVVESAPWDPARQSLDGRGGSGGRPPVLVGVRVEYREEELRRRIKAGGGRWLPGQRLWLLPLTLARKLDVAQRAVAVPDAANAPQVYSGSDSTPKGQG
jgi:hypothetical protein